MKRWNHSLHLIIGPDLIAALPLWLAAPGACELRTGTLISAVSHFPSPDLP